MRYAQDAADLIATAASTARAMGHSFVGTAHLLLALMIRHQDDLLPRLNDEEKEIFEKYADAASEMYSHTNLAAFVSGFTLGAKIMVEVLTSDDETG